MMNILFEDKHLLFLAKEPGQPVQPDPSGDQSLLDDAEDHIRQKGGKNKLHLVNRLDRPVGGVVLLTKSREATAHVSKQAQSRQVFKDYLVVVHGQPEKDVARLTDHLLKVGKKSISKVVDPGTRGAKEAALTYKVLETITDPEWGHLSLVNVRLITGRHHQIRVQLSHAGMPIWGDTKYNPAYQKKKGWWAIALWSHKMRLRHPFGKKEASAVSYPDWTQAPWSGFQSLQEDQ